MNSKNTRQKSRNEIITDQPSEQKTAKPSCLYEIQAISKQLIDMTKNEFEALGN